MEKFTRANAILVKDLNEARKFLETYKENEINIFKTQLGYAFVLTRKYFHLNDGKWLPNTLALYDTGRMWTANAYQACIRGGIYLGICKRLAYCEGNNLIIEKMKEVEGVFSNSVGKYYEAFAIEEESDGKVVYPLDKLADIKWGRFVKCIEGKVAEK